MTDSLDDERSERSERADVSQLSEGSARSARSGRSGRSEAGERFAPWDAVAALAVVALAAWWILSAYTPPRPVPSTAPDGEFSAERAFQHVEHLAKSPRPLGTAAHGEARAYLMERLTALGLQPELQQADVVRRVGADRIVTARVRNVVARIPGRQSSGAVILLAHYDSRPNTPGAGDALSAVATVLETLRALTSEPALDNDVIVLFSDGEELGLLGARAFVDHHPWAEDVRLVLNFEARGNRGPSPMFETRDGNLELLRGFQEAAPHPYATSLTHEIYQRMPNDTDFSVFRDAGIQGLNMAFIGNLAAYHTALDRAESLDLGSLQHQGSYALSLTRYFGRFDLEKLEESGRQNAVYFNPYPWRLVVYPTTWVVPLAVFGIVVLALGVVLCRARRRLELGGVARGLALFVLSIGASGAIGYGLWATLRHHLPGLLFGPHGLPPHPESWTLVIWLLTIASVAALATWLSGEEDTLGVAAGAWLGWAALTVVLVLQLPGASYVLCWPFIGGALGLVVLGAPGSGKGFAHTTLLIVAVSAVPAIFLFLPMLEAVGEALTLRLAWVIGAGAALLSTTVAPILASVNRSSGGKLAAGFALAAIVLFAWTVYRTAPSVETPAIDSLAYGVDREAGDAWWTSWDETPAPWLAEIFEESTDRSWAPGTFFLPDTQVLLAPAAAVELASPSAELTDDSRSDGRRVAAVVRSNRDAPVLRIRGEASVPFVSVTVAGTRFDFAGDPEADGLGEVWITAYGYGSEGLPIGFEVASRWPIELELIDQSWTFEGLEVSPPVRPESRIPASDWRTDAVYVRDSSLL